MESPNHGLSPPFAAPVNSPSPFHDPGTASYHIHPMHPAATALPMPFAQMFFGAHNFSIHGSTINAIGGDMIMNDSAELQHELRRLREEIRQLQRNCPASVGYSDANAVKITNALGETFSVPWELVRSQEDMHYIMMKHFAGKPGERRVAERRYCISRQDDGSLVRLDNWENNVKSGEKLVMSMLIEKVLVPSIASNCPQCGRTALGTYTDGAWTVCRVCTTRFTYSLAEADTRAVPPQPDSGIRHFRHVRKSFVKVGGFFDRWTCTSMSMFTLICRTWSLIAPLYVHVHLTEIGSD
ncbi:hypothetical protein FA15DRAFT_671232 [Coprinopsis marcescibilis]|uniref:Ubiquitin-like domain-containing protein n=1 Tax=Coprinopsis marcescibilis TaxID=230819 RepID=A0A5C3KQK7_COPMA|nr:hypothetical protein FA15DRAFT_671232 [Coprinopsis marcescibilis]